MQTTNKTSPGDVTHPRREEWMDYLYAEISRADKTRLTAHLRCCGQCCAEVERWQSAREALNWGKTTGMRARTRISQPLIKWGIAAALTLTVGFSAGRFFAPSASNARELRASLKSELLAELKQQQQQEFANYELNAEQKRALDDKLILAAIDRIDAGRQADYASLHKELETVAVLTQASLQSAQQQIVTLASYTQSEEHPSN